MKSRISMLCLLLLVGSRLIAADQNSSGGAWTVATAPFPPVNLTAQAGTMWVCGADEMIVSSKDGGASWQTKHLTRDGEVLFDISFADEKFGYATGTGGLVLSSDDGGETWKRHAAPGRVRAISFGDRMNGISVIDDGRSSTRISSSDQAKPIAGAVKITHDGGDHWDDVAATNSDEVRPFDQTLSIGALDEQHFLMLRRHPEVEDVFVVTKDGGKSWKVVHPRNDGNNRELPRMVFVHEGEYWAFGHELVHREKGGGYGAPLTMHSKDGETWTHGVAGQEEFDSCNSGGCYMWDGAVESLYGEHERFWALPQGGMNEKWAIAGSAGCTIDGGALKCGPAITVEKPPDRPEVAGGLIFVNPKSRELVDGCVMCSVREIAPEKAGPPSLQEVSVSIKLQRDGRVASVSVDYPSSKRISDEIAGQLSKWLLEPAHKGSETVDTNLDLSLVLMCSGFPGRPETSNCMLHSADDFGGLRSPVKVTTTTIKQ